VEDILVYRLENLIGDIIYDLERNVAAYEREVTKKRKIQPTTWKTFLHEIAIQSIRYKYGVMWLSILFLGTILFVLRVFVTILIFGEFK